MRHQRNRELRGCTWECSQVLPIRAIAPIPCALYTIDSSDLPSATIACKPREHAHRLRVIVYFPCTLKCIHVPSRQMNKKNSRRMLLAWTGIILTEDITNMMICH